MGYEDDPQKSGKEQVRLEMETVPPLEAGTLHARAAIVRKAEG